MKRKIVGIILAVGMVAGVTACGEDKDGLAQGGETIVNTTPVSTPTAVPTEAPTPTEEEPPAEEIEQFSWITPNYNGIMNNLGGDNSFVYSPEAFNVTLDMYGRLLADSSEKNNINAILHDKDCLGGYAGSLFHGDEEKKDLTFYNYTWYDTAYLDEANIALDNVYMYYTQAISEYDREKWGDKITDIKNTGISQNVPDYFRTPIDFTKTVCESLSFPVYDGKWDASYEVFGDTSILFTAADGWVLTPKAIGAHFSEENDDALCGYAEFDDADLASLVLADGNVMHIILPKEDTDIHSIEIERYIGSMNHFAKPYDYHSVDEMNLVIPCFVLNNEWVMTEDDEELKELWGFTRLGDKSIKQKLWKGAVQDFVEEIPHTARYTLPTVCVDENGEEVEKPEFTCPQEAGLIEDEDGHTTYNFLCNRPFIFAIYDVENDGLAFVGQVMGTDAFENVKY